MKNDQSLPAKEGSTFKNVLKLYDSKQYKKAIKLADSILKKFPDNGETMCMKGLSVYHMYDQKNSKDEAKKAEGFDLVKLGLRKNIRSYVCWHVFGIIQRARGKHHEAIKAYLSALRVQPNNQQILRDTALLQMRVRDIEGLIKTRHQLLSLQGTVRSNWVGFCIAHYLAKNYQMAEAIVDSYLTTLGSNKKQDVTLKYVKSEALLFKAKLYLESKQFDKCLAFLEDEAIQSEVTDRIFIQETLGMLYLREKNFPSAKKVYMLLLRRNMDNLSYHFGFIAALAQYDSVRVLQQKGVTEFDVFSLSKVLTADLKREVIDFCQEMKQLAVYNKNWTLDIVLLCLLEAASFEKHAEIILRKNLTKGVPKLFDFFKCFFTYKKKSTYLKLDMESTVIESLQNEATNKITTVAAIIDKYILSLEATSKFQQDDSEKQTPDVLIWAKFFKAQQLFYVQEPKAALQLVSDILIDVPTLVPIYIFKAEILTSMGDHIAAAYSLNVARKIDLQDRYINTVCSQSLARSNLINSYFNDFSIENSKFEELCGRNEFAEEVVGLFARHEGDARTNLFEMQVIWYSEAAALSAERMLFAKCAASASKGEISKYLALALKHNYELLTYFEAFEEDQTDFHSYCLRKGGLTCYADFLEHIQSLKYSSVLVHALSRILLLLYFLKSNFDFFKTKKDRIKDLEECLKSESDTSEKKRLKQEIHQLKKQLKKEDEHVVAEKSADNTTHKKNRRRRQIKADPDPHGLVAFEEIRASLDEKIGLVSDLLEKSSSESVEAMIAMAVEGLRQGKPLSAVKLLRKASRLELDESLKAKVFYVGTLLLSVLSGQTVQFHAVGKTPVNLSWQGDAKVKIIASEVIRDILGCAQSVKQCIEAYEQKQKPQGSNHLISLNILLAKRSCNLIDNAAAAKEIEDAIKTEKVDATEAMVWLETFISFGPSKEDVTRLVELLREKFPLSSDFLFFQAV